MRSLPFLIVCFLIFCAKIGAQKFGIEYDSSETKIAIKDLQSGKLVSDFIYHDIEIMDLLGIINDGKKYGLFDVNSGKVYCCEYDMIEEFDSINYSGVKGVVRKNGKKGLVGLSKETAKLEIILPLEYKNIELSADLDYLYIVRKGKKYGLFNLKSRKFIIPCTIDGFPTIETFNNYMVVRKKKEKYGLFDLNGRMLLKPKYKAIYALCTGADVFEVREGKKSSIYDGRIEKFLVEPIDGSLELSEIDDRFYSLFYKRMQTYIDTQTGKPVLPLAYNFMGILYKSRYMSVEYKGKFGVYDFKDLKLIVLCSFDTEEELIEKKGQYFD